MFYEVHKELATKEYKYKMGIKLKYYYFLEPIFFPVSLHTVPSKFKETVCFLYEIIWKIYTDSRSKSNFNMQTQKDKVT